MSRAEQFALIAGLNIGVWCGIAAAAVAVGTLTAHSWSHINPGEYRTGGEVTILYNPAGAPAGVTDEQVRAGIEAWDGHANIRVRFALTGAPLSKWDTETADGLSVVAWRPGDKLGSTVFAGDECDVRLGSDYDFGYYDVTWVVAHEVGHCLGLGHTDVRGSVMFGSVGSQRFEGLSADDIAGLRAAYPYRTTVGGVSK